MLFKWGESRGCTREEMISFFDSEGNVPLHSAVHGYVKLNIIIETPRGCFNNLVCYSINFNQTFYRSGDIKAVELCLKSGAKISTQQHDLSTPVHLAW